MVFFFFFMYRALRRSTCALYLVELNPILFVFLCKAFFLYAFHKSRLR